MTKIPLGISKYSIIPNFPFIILTKTIGTGINRIGQAKLKNEVFHYSRQKAAHGACEFCLGDHTGRVESAAPPNMPKNLIFANQTCSNIFDSFHMTFGHSKQGSHRCLGST